MTVPFLTLLASRAILIALSITSRIRHALTGGIADLAFSAVVAAIAITGLRSSSSRRRALGPSARIIVRVVRYASC